MLSFMIIILFLLAVNISLVMGVRDSGVAIGSAIDIAIHSAGSWRAEHEDEQERNGR